MNATVFDRWASWWNSTEQLNRGIYAAALSRVTGEHRRVLDVGCGTGLLGRLLVEAHPVRTVVGVDLSPAMVAKAQQLAGTHGQGRLQFQTGDAEQLPFGDGAFDAVVNTLSFHHLPHPETALAEFRRVVHPGGPVIIVDVVFPYPLDRIYNWINPLWASLGGREWVKNASAMTALMQGAGLQALEVAQVRYPLPARVFCGQVP